MIKREWLYKKRKDKDLTQSEVATLSGIARTTYAMIESGKRDPSVFVAKKIAEVLDFEWTFFFEKQLHEMRNTNVI